LADAVLPGKAYCPLMKAYAFPADVGCIPPTIDFGKMAPETPYLITGDWL
jgi:hypothetical protein